MSNEVRQLFLSLIRIFGEKTGKAIAATIVEELGGLRVSIPDVVSFERQERNKKIVSLLGKERYSNLAMRFSLSRNHISRIARKEQNRKRLDPSLPFNSMSQ